MPKIETPNELAVQAVYWVLVLFAIMFTVLSFKSGRIMLIKYGYVIMLIRNILRLFNFENSDGSDNINVLQ